MNKRFLIMITIALLCATLAAWIANNWIKNKGSSPAEVSNPIVVAAVEIPFGTKLDESHIKIIQWRSSDLPDGVFTKNEDILGKISKNMFFPGEIITEQRVAEHLEGSALASLISIHSRAISIRVNDVVGVAGFIQPGNKVDILSTVMLRQGSKQKAITKTLLTNIKVLAVDQDVSPDKQKPTVVRAVTLELTPKKAEKIVAAMQEGKIQLTLRNPLDNIEPDEEVIILEPSKTKVIRKKYRPPSVSVIPWGSQSEKRCRGNIC